MYGKIFDSMYDGTLYGQWEAIVTFQQMIVLCDADGTVDITPPAISARTSIPLEIITKGLEVLSKPDPYSRTPGSDGRRIELIDDHRPWGWTIINHAKYKMMVDSETVREQNRERQRRHRAKQEANNNAPSRSVTPVTQSNAPSRHTDTDTDTKKTPVAPLALPEWLDKEKWQAYVKTRPAKSRTPDSLKAALEKLEKFRALGEDANAIIAESLANGWQGLFLSKSVKGEAVPASQSCARCGGSLSAGHTQRRDGKVCNACEAAS